MVSGVDVKEELAANIQTREIPIVVVTGSPQESSGRRPRLLLTKPVMPEEPCGPSSGALSRFA